jgi:hypothetical protein
MLKTKGSVRYPSLRPRENAISRDNVTTLLDPIRLVVYLGDFTLRVQGK